jgi:hypothetical protein
VDLEFLLIQLLLKMGVATAVASALGRSREFKKLLFATRRSRERSVYLHPFCSGRLLQDSRQEFPVRRSWL